MKLLFDQNLSYRLVSLLAAEYPGSAHVRDVGLAAAADSLVWDYARNNGFTIASKDSDFEQRAFVHGYPPKVIWIRLGNSPTAAAEALLRSRHADVLAFEADADAAILVLA